MLNNFCIGNKKIGPGEPTFIIAEAGVNHNGDIDLAKKLIDVAVEAGADVVKFQTFTAEYLSVKNADQCDYQKNNIGKEETQFEMLKRLELAKDSHKPLQEYCEQKGILFLSTPFSEVDADFLEVLDVQAFKSPSGEINNYPFLEHIAKKGKPMIISSGMSTMEEVHLAIKCVRDVGNNNIAVLHCTSNYPPSLEALNLNVLKTMLKELNVPIGYSDHSEGITAGIAAVAIGACVIEKHFTLDKKMEGPDHRASLDPEELKALVKAIRDTEKMLGSYEKKCTPEEEGVRHVIRKSLVARENISEGKIIELEDIIIKRPGSGFSPGELKNVIGKKAIRDIIADTVLSATDFE